jgi:hypothetical protein
MYKVNHDHFRLNAEESACLDKQFESLIIKHAHFIMKNGLSHFFVVAIEDKEFRIKFKWPKGSWVDADDGRGKRIADDAVPIGATMQYRDYRKNAYDHGAVEKYTCSEFYNKTMIDLNDIFGRTLRAQMRYHDHKCNFCES